MCVAPYMGAWIETRSYAHSYRVTNSSHPTWVRGLKLFERIITVRHIMSHPTWVRGLKPQQIAFGVFRLGRTLHGCVD